MNKFGAIAVAALMGACGGDEIEDETTVQQSIISVQHISDAANPPGAIGFYFYQPLANADPTGTGTFNGTLRNRMSIQVWTTACSGANTAGTLVLTVPAQVYATATPPTYKAVISSTSVANNACYRIIPTLDGKALGFRDVHVTAGTAAADYRKWQGNLTVAYRVDGTFDADNDGVLNHVDNCQTVANPGQQDSNSNGVGDACEVADADGDGVADGSDNCPNTANPGQENSDTDAAGDACDGCPTDGLKLAAGVCGCGFLDTDSDGDGQADGPGSGSACGDYCPTDNTKKFLADTQGADKCGCNVPNTDSDSDGVAACNEACDNTSYKTGSGSGVCGCSAYDNDADGHGDVDNCPPTVTCGPT